MFCMHQSWRIDGAHAIMNKCVAMECLLAIALCFLYGQNNGWQAGADSAVVATLVTVVAGPLDPRGGKAWRPQAPSTHKG
jgi:hypothetical protein